MTQLNNIFIGNKVVKQAFLNDAVIYQSNGWEPTPSTMQRVFSKTYTEIPDMGGTVSVKVDSKGNIISARRKGLYKTDADGKLLWQKTIFASNSNFGITSMIVNKNDNIFCGGNDATFMQINPYTGEVIKKIDLKSKYNVNSIAAIAADSNQIYAITKPPINFLNIDLNGNVISVTPWTSNYSNYTPSSMATGDFKHMYIVIYNLEHSYDTYAFRLDKRNPNSYVTIVSSVLGGFQSRVVADSIGNAYITYTGELHKYLSNSNLNFAWKTDSPISNGGYFSELAIDQQDNVYVFDRYNICKYSSDGTLLWYNDMWHNDIYLEMVCDKNNLIVSSGYQNDLTKLLNLVKKS